MKFSVLGSGSSGNSSYIEMGKKKFLIDAGFSGKKIAEKLNNIGRRIEDIDGIFVTHEHSDHIQGLGVISRKYDIPINDSLIAQVSEFTREQGYHTLKELQ